MLIHRYWKGAQDSWYPKWVRRCSIGAPAKVDRGSRSRSPPRGGQECTRGGPRLHVDRGCRCSAVPSVVRTELCSDVDPPVKLLARGLAVLAGGLDDSGRRRDGAALAGWGR